VSAHPHSVAAFRMARELADVFISSFVFRHSRQSPPQYLLDILASAERDMGRGRDY